MASSDFLENAISSKVDESAVSDLASSLENSISSPAAVRMQGGQRMIVRTVGASGGVPGPGPGPPGAPQLLRPGPGQQILRTTSGQMVVTSGGVRPGLAGQPVLVARQGGVVQQQQVGQQQVRQLVQLPQQQQQARPPVSLATGGAGAGVQRVVINQPGVRPGQPGSQITVPLATLQSLQAGQGIPTGQPGHLLVKTETGQYQILRVGPQGQATAPAAPTGPTATPPAAPTPVRLPTVPAVRQPASVAAPALPSAASAAMGQQMTPDTAKHKCKNFLATLLRLASDQPESVARNVRALIQGLIDGRVEPEVFTTKLQKELNSSPQPCLVPFLKKSLPYLQHSLATRELTIEGVAAPTMAQVGKLPPAASLASPAPARQTFVRPAPVSALSRPTFVRPALPVRPVSHPGPGLPAPRPPQPGAVHGKKSGNAYSAAGDDDINDVAAMGGVNLAEEAGRMGSTDNVGSVIRSCKDEIFLATGLLHQKITRICREKGLEAPPPEVLNLVSHATQDRLKTLVGKLSVIAEHRLDIIKAEGPYEPTQDTRAQLRFIEELDRAEKRRHEEAEREMLIRAAKSRTKTDDPEKEKLKAKAREIQRVEAATIQQEEANRTALEAIGSHKKRKFGEVDGKMGGGATNVPLRARTKRVHLRDIMFLMEQEKHLKHSDLLFRSYST